MEVIVKEVTLVLAGVVEGIAALIIAMSIVRASINYTWSIFNYSKEVLNIRLQLGKALALSLEFLLAADILRTAITPNWDDIGKLAAIAALRTMLNYFLERELKHGSIQSFKLE